jgi:flavodoxin
VITDNSQHFLGRPRGIGLVLALLCSFLPAVGACAAKEQTPVAKRGKILVAYFSHSGNTRYLAERIHGRVGGDMFEIKIVKPYPRDYDAVVDQAKREQAIRFRPQLAHMPPDLKSYDVVFIGYPNWWGTMPMALFTFLEAHDFSEKTIVPFCTHEGSGLGRSERDSRKLCPTATVVPGLAIRGGAVVRADRDVANWLKKLGLLS